MGIYQIKPYFQATLRPVTNWLTQRALSPDWMTGGAVLVAGAIGAALPLAAGAPSWLWLVAAGAGARLTLNALDGEVARGLGFDSPWGEVKNELGDRIADALIFGGLLLAPYTSILLSTLALLVVLLTGYVGILGKAITGKREYGGMLGKPDRMVGLALTCIVVALTGWWWLFSLFLVTVTILGAVTIFYRLEAIHERC